MAKIDISFYDKKYSIDESSFAAAADELKHHLSTTMNGSGTVINLCGTAYNVDSTKLSNAENDFITHLRTIAGAGSKVVINGVEYGIDSTKVQTAVSDLEIVLGGLKTDDGYETVYEPLNITWDCNTEGLMSVGEFYKVSDIIIVNNEDVKKVVFKHSQISEETYLRNDWENMVTMGYVTDDVAFAGMIAFVKKDGATLMGATFPEKGIYFMHNKSAHIEYIYTTEPIEIIKG